MVISFSRPSRNQTRCSFGNREWQTEGKLDAEAETYDVFMQPMPDWLEPMAATLRFKDGKGEVTPFPIDYESFNDPARNKFYQTAPEIAHAT